MNTSRKNKLALAVVAASALAVAGLGTAGIKDTRHNLGSSQTTGNQTDATGEICVFCHTPHGSDTSASVPLWNRSLTPHTGYTTYDQLGTSSLDGAIVEVGSVSIACLSCHDGQQAMDVMANDPGSGVDNGTDGGTWSGTLSDGGAGASTMDSTFGITFIGADLRNDHPVGIQYAGGGLHENDGESGRYSDTSLFGDKDFKRPVKGNANGTPIWWVPTTNSAGSANIGDEVNGAIIASGASRSGTTDNDFLVRNKTDMQLYTRALVSTGSANGGNDGQFDISGGSGAEPYVECASCHDPHSTNPTFLRVDNTASGVCLACHTK